MGTLLFVADRTSFKSCKRVFVFLLTSTEYGTGYVPINFHTQGMQLEALPLHHQLGIELWPQQRLGAWFEAFGGPGRLP